MRICRVPQGVRFREILSRGRGYPKDPGGRGPRDETQEIPELAYKGYRTKMKAMTWKLQMTRTCSPSSRPNLQENMMRKTSWEDWKTQAQRLDSGPNQIEIALNKHQ